MTQRLDLDRRAWLAVIARIQIEQVLVNLMRNAIEAMAGRERRELTVATTARNDDSMKSKSQIRDHGFPPRSRTISARISSTQNCRVITHELELPRNWSKSCIHS